MVEFDPLSRAVIGAAIEVHRILGPGFRESVYHKALARELTLREIQFVSETSVKVEYKDINVGTHEPDFLVADALVVELKVVETIIDVHVVQIVSSMRHRKANWTYPELCQENDAGGCQTCCPITPPILRPLLSFVLFV